jgi:ADP-heptose:LPS heptosyltransferase
MFEGIRRRVGIKCSRRHFRHTRERVINFTDALSRSHRALVIFPDSLIDRESAHTIMQHLLRKFNSEKITVLIRDDQLFAMASTPPIKTLTYSHEDVNTWFLPRRRLLEKMETSTFDVALDLNVELSLPSAFLCRASDAPLRISFAKEEGDQFYNFQVNAKSPADNFNVYRGFLNCLDMF